MGRPLTDAGMQRKLNSLKLDDALDLRRTVDEVLLGIGSATETETQQVIMEMSKETAKRLKSESEKHNWKNYARGWTYEKKPDKRGKMTYVLYNKKYGPLTHLLENGHEKVLWGRATGDRVPGTPHIAPVNDWLEEALPKAIEDALNKTL